MLDESSSTNGSFATTRSQSSEVMNGENGIQPQNDNEETSGSSVQGAIFNFTNSIIGAGAIGLGGAIALSGGLISIFTIIFFGILTKLSLDMVIQLSIQMEASYEELGRVAFGQVGWVAVVLSKSLYSFGCLVAYIKVVEDNFASALSRFVPTSDDSWISWILARDDVVTLLLSTTIILPLCLLRDMSSLSQLSAVSILSMIFIVAIVIYLYVDDPGIRTEGGSVYENWFEIRPGYLESLGTFVFTFVSQHTVHLAYESLRSDARNLSTWKRVSSVSIGMATSVSLTVGIVVYMTFWQESGSDLFEMYPSSLQSIDLSKILLCITMLLTFPLPFFTCREMITVSLTHSHHDTSVLVSTNGDEEIEDPTAALQRPLLQDEEEPPHDAEATSPRLPEHSESQQREHFLLLPGHDKQLKLPYHVGITVLLWALVTILAILAPSLGDVLDLVGCATGTVIAFVLPSLFSFQMCGYTRLAAFILIVGGIVGVIGTTFSLQKLISDL